MSFLFTTTLIQTDPSSPARPLGGWTDQIVIASWRQCAPTCCQVENAKPVVENATQELQSGDSNHRDLGIDKVSHSPCGMLLLLMNEDRIHG